MVEVMTLLNENVLGGTQLNAIDFATALGPLGYRSHLFVYAGGSSTGTHLAEYASTRHVRIEVLKRPSSTLGAAQQLAQAARQTRADLVHVYGDSVMIRDGYWGPALLGHRPMVMTVYDMAVAPRVPRHQALVVGTGYQIDEESRRRKRVMHISPPVDTDRDDPELVSPEPFITRFALSREKTRIVLVSRLDEAMKAVAVRQSMEAVRSLGSKYPIELVVVGGGDAEIALRVRAEDINRELSERVITMTGPLADPRPAYASADIAIGMGGSAARALAFARPLVVSGEAGWYRTFEPATAAELLRNSFWSNAKSPTAASDLKACLVPLIEDPTGRATLGAFGRLTALERFSLRAMASRTARMYEALLANPYPTVRWMADLPQESGKIIDGLLRRARAPSRSARRGCR